MAQAASKITVGTSNVHNTGIMHWVPKFGGRVACSTNRAIMATEGETFAAHPKPCRKCLAKYNSAVSRSAAKVSA